MKIFSGPEVVDLGSAARVRILERPGPVPPEAVLILEFTDGRRAEIEGFELIQVSRCIDEATADFDGLPDVFIAREESSGASGVEAES